MAMLEEFPVAAKGWMDKAKGKGKKKPMLKKAGKMCKECKGKGCKACKGTGKGY